MGAIYGFSGAPDKILARRMSSTLAHRGKCGPTCIEQRFGTLCYRPNSEPEILKKLGAGLYHDPGTGQAIGLAGYLVDKDKTDHLFPRLLQLYRQEGPSFISRLRGAFVIAIHDGEDIHVARDSAGIRTVYYGCFDGRFRYAVEPKGILADPGIPRRIRPAAIAQYLAFSFIPGSDTMLEGLFELPPGHIVSFRRGERPLLTRYFFFENTAVSDRQDDSYWVHRFREEFGKSVEECILVDEPVGIFLSGGIDSSVVAVEVARRCRQKVKTYAVHFGKKYPDELEFARAVAERCGTEHEEVLIRPKDFLPRLRQIIWHLDDPIGDPISAPNFELSKRVSQDVRWIFNGEGGDPCFGGPKNTTMLLHHWYGGIKRDPNFRERMYLASYRRAYDDLSGLLTPGWQQRINHEIDLVGVLRPFFTESRPVSFLHKLLAINIRLKGAHLILPKVDRMAGAWGLTTFSPLFDERLIRLAFKMPGKMILRGGIEKWILKRSYEDYLPADVIARPKSGMRVPVHFWFRGELKRYARKILSPKNIERAGIFRPERVKQLLDYNIDEGPGRYGLRLWMLLTFEIWRRIVIEGEKL